jgi:CRP/FNR family transcriptional regulator, nitrogen fixation regulation protein
MFQASITERPALGLQLGGVPRTVPKGETVFKEGDKADFFYIVASGVVRTYTDLNDGRRIIDNYHFADDILGLNPGAQHRFYAASVCDSVVASFRRSDLDRVLECDKELCRRVRSSLLVSLGRAQDHVVLMGLRTASEKIEAFLGTMAERVSRSGTSKLRLRHSDIADYLGLSRETVSRVLAQLAPKRNALAWPCKSDPGRRRALVYRHAQGTVPAEAGVGAVVVRTENVMAPH